MKRMVIYMMAVLVLAGCLEGCVSRERYAAMRAGLDSINAVNRSGQPFTVQDVRPYVEFFDDHGESNDRLLAHYLLGLAYYDHGEAPMALQCYQDALDCADTARTDCDYAQLSRVYAQMAEVFYHQGLYRKTIEYDRGASLYAWLGKDTLAALMSDEQQSLSYKQLNIIDSSLNIAKRVDSLYSLYGYSRNSAIIKGSISWLYLNLKDYEKAKKYMSEYETLSGLFSHNNIESGREIYYYFKGILYLEQHRLDSALYFFRKELQDGKDFNNQNGGALGLAIVYDELHQSDSAAKYYQYAYSMNDSIYARKTTEVVERMQAMYDYSRHQEEAKQEKEKAAHRTVLVWICIGIIAFLCVLGYAIYERMNHNRRETEYKYLQSLETIRQARKDIERLKAGKAESTNSIIDEKKRVIQKQEDILKVLSKEPLIYKNMTINGEEPSLEEWEVIKSQVFELFPRFADFMTSHEQLLNDKEYKTCILTYAGFKPKMISSMLSVDPSYISKIRREMLVTLFAVSGSSKDFDKAIREL